MGLNGNSSFPTANPHVPAPWPLIRIARALIGRQYRSWNLGTQLKCEKRTTGTHSSARKTNSLANG